MEILVRWSCDCTAPRWACINCKGKGQVERWIPAELVQLFRRKAFIGTHRHHEGLVSTRIGERAASSKLLPALSVVRSEVERSHRHLINVCVWARVVKRPHRAPAKEHSHEYAN